LQIVVIIKPVSKTVLNKVKENTSSITDGRRQGPRNEGFG
jgi:hypothetical protein